MNNTIQNELDPTTPAQAVERFQYPSFFKQKDALKVNYLALFSAKRKINITLYGDGDATISHWSLEPNSSDDKLINSGTEIASEEFNAAMREAIVRLRPEESEQPKPRKTPEQWLDLEADVDKSHLNWNQVEALKVTQIT